MAFEAGDEARATALLAESLAVFKAMGNGEGVANVLDMFAGLAAAQGRTERAARLWGAAERLHDPGTTRVSPIRRTRYEGYRAAAHAQRAEAPFTQAWAEGRAMALEQAIAYALDEAG